MAARTRKRASSRADTPCPHCNKLLHGGKELKAHVANAHPQGGK